MKRGKEQQPQKQEISVRELLAMLQDAVTTNQTTIDQIRDADADSGYRVKCWIENDRPMYSIKKKGIIGFKR